MDREVDRVVYTVGLPEKYQSWEDQEAVTYCFAIRHEMMHSEHRGSYKPIPPDSNPFDKEDPWLPVHLYLDDVRDTPKGAYRTYTVEQTINHLDMLHRCGRQADSLSLDNDLGQDPRTGEELKEGHKVLTWILEQMHTDSTYRPPKVIRAHTANPVAKERMLSDIQKILEMAEDSST